jgi:hypothetical protein
VTSQRRKRLIIGVAYLLAGFAALGLAAWGGIAPDWTWWVLFTLAFAALDWQAVEVNDRLFASSGVMPLFTAGVVFALQSGSAVLGMALMAVAGPFVPRDFRERRVFQPVANFGQMVLSATAAGLALDVLLAGTSEFTIRRTGNLFLVAVAGATAALVYTVVNLVLVRIAVRTVYGSRNLQPWSGMATILISQLAMGLLGGLLGGVLLATGSGAVPLILFVYVTGHLVTMSYARLREAHESTLRGFVKSLEARDLYTRGHTERVAEFCRLIGEELGFTGTQLERMRWAALIHDVGKLAVPGEIMRKQGQLNDEEYRELRRSTHLVDDLLSEVDFLRPMVEVASGCHPRLTDEDFGQAGHRHLAEPSLEQRVLAVADAFDAMTSNRAHRMAGSQDLALSTLREDPHPLFDPDVLAALERGLARHGRWYGPSELARGVTAGAGRRG